MKSFALTIAFLQFGGLVMGAAIVVENEAATVAVRDPAALPRIDLPAGKMIWTGEIVEGGPTVVLNGTIEQIWALKAEKDPKFLTKPLPETNTTLVARQNPIASHDCYNGLEPAYVQVGFSAIRPIEDGIRHLKQVGGQCGCGPYSCCRISCSWDAAVHYCNDNPYPTSMPCRTLGEWFLQHLNNHCTRDAYTWPVEGTVEVCGGRVWPYSGFWTLTLREEGC